MKLSAYTLLTMLGLAAGWPASLPAQSSAPIKACSLLPMEEVKRHLPWEATFDQLQPAENPIGTFGSSCEYPSVGIQVLPSSSRMLEIAREKGGLEPVSGIGDEAYFHNNAGRFAELYVRVGKHLLTLQAGGNNKVESLKPGVLSLAKALVAKLR